MSTISISICLSDLPREKIKKASNGKKYINLRVAERKETDKYGNTHTVYVSRTAEERQAGVPVVFVGNGTEHAPAIVTRENIDNMPPVAGDEDMPF